MKKTVVTVALLAFAAISVAVLIVKESRHRSAIRAVEGSRAVAASSATPAPEEPSAATSTPPPLEVEAAPSSPATATPKEQPVAMKTAPTSTAPKAMAATDEPKAAKPSTQKTVAPASTAAASAAPELVAFKPKLIVYYFHTTARCPSCLKIENYTNEAVKDGFPQELASGRIEWRMTNIEEPENNHFAKDYKLFTKSVVLSRVEGGREVRWKNLDQVWNLLGDPAKFREYILSEVKAFLGEAS